MVAIDVQNSFSTLSWDLILEELDRRGVSTIVKAVMREYFRDRWITIHTPQALVDLKIMAGVLQGSVLGPFLWNMVYDGVLKALNGDKHTQVIAYADDLAILFSARDSQQLEDNLAATMSKLEVWFRKTGLRVAAEKMEVIFLTGKRISKIMDLRIMGSTITTSEAVRYLGVTMDCWRKFRPHLEKATARGDRLMGALASLLSNTRGPSQHARRLYSSGSL